MSWDIYGQALQPGYCEVHPAVPVPYPCYLCQEDHANALRQRELTEFYEDQERQFYAMQYAEMQFEGGIGLS